MSYTIRPGRYLVERTRRQLVGVIAKVGTGGSVPGPVQDALTAYVNSVAEASPGGNKREIAKTEMGVIKDAMKRLQGTWLVLYGGGLMWVYPGKDTESDLKKAVKKAGWNVGAEHLRALAG